MSKITTPNSIIARKDEITIKAVVSPAQVVSSFLAVK